VKNPDEFMAQAMPPQMAGPAGMPAGMPPSMPPAIPNPQQATAEPMGPLTGDPAKIQALLGQQGMMPPQ